MRDAPTEGSKGSGGRRIDAGTRAIWGHRHLGCTAPSCPPSRCCSLPHGPWCSPWCPCRLVGCACPPCSIPRSTPPPLPPSRLILIMIIIYPCQSLFLIPCRATSNKPTTTIIAICAAHPRLRLWTCVHCPSFSHSLSFLSFTPLFLFTCPHNLTRHDSHANPGGQNAQVSLPLVVCLPAIISTY